MAENKYSRLQIEYDEYDNNGVRIRQGKEEHTVKSVATALRDFSKATGGVLIDVMRVKVLRNRVR